jgi:hypothetical protein
MPQTPIHRVRFPDGDVEYRSTRGDLTVGSVISSRGVRWRVVGYDGATVLVERAGPGPSSAGIDETLPYPLGVEPPRIDVMTVA